jgi:beta-lactamase regulating signal transducer with metallopeptidase domain
MNTEVLFPALCELLLKSAVVSALAGLASVLWRGASAASRHLIWALALATLLALPLTKLAAPLWTVKLVPRITRAALPPISMPEMPAASAPTTPAVARTQSWVPPSWRDALVCVWLAGVTAVLGYRAAGSLRLRRLRRRSEPLTDERARALAHTVAAECGLAGAVELRRSPACRVPLVWGVWRPVVLLPDAALAWPGQRLVAALRHEFGHVRRRDCLARLLAQMACAVYWMNPLVWLAARRLRVAQEQACDDLALRSGTSASDYADLLVEVARGPGVNGLLSRHALAMAQPSTLEARVRAIVDERRNREPLRRGAMAMGATTAVALVAASALAQVGEKADAGEPQPQIMVEAKIIELPAGEVAALLPGKNRITMLPAPSETEAITRKISAMKNADVLCAPRVVTLSGQHAQIVVGREINFGKDGSKQIMEGVALDVLPKLQTDGRIQLVLTLTIRKRLPDAREPFTEQSFRVRQTSTTAALAPSHTLLVGGMEDVEDRAVLLMLTASQVADAGGKPPAPKKPSASEEKARRMVVPSLEFREASLPDVVAFLVAKSREFDPEKKGVNIVLRLSDAKPPAITLNLRDVPLSKALKYVAQIADLELVADDHALRLEPKRGK